MTDDSLQNPRMREALALNERRGVIRARLTAEAERQHAIAAGNNGPHSRAAAIYEHALIQALDHDNMTFLRHLSYMKRTPVPIEEFIHSTEFLGGLQEIWPKLLPDIRTMNPDIFLGEAPVHEALLGGATGTGKTTLCYTTNAYQAYLFECFHKPQELYGLSSVTPIVFMMQSISQTITKRIIYKPFRDLFTAMKFTQRWVDWEKRRESELRLGSGVVIVPALANLDAILGQAIAGSMQDEVNFMQIIENSKQVAGARGQGGLYDQAKEIYTNISRRRARSFMTKGYSLGTLCILSSTRYKNDFLDQRMEEVRQNHIPNIVILRRKQYEVVPEERFAGPKFGLVIGTDEYPTKVIEEDMVAGEDYPEAARIEMVPVEYKHRFKTDPDGALRDIVGIATDTIAPFIQQRHKLVDAVVRFEDRKLKSLCPVDQIDLTSKGMPQWDEKAIKGLTPAQKAAPRFVHVDLSINTDPTGVAVIRVDDWVSRPSLDNPEILETLPRYVVECAVSIKPSPQCEIDIAEVRRWVMQLQQMYECPIYSFTYDGFQSVESRQALIAAGVRSDNLNSMDRSLDPYLELRRTFYEDRIDMGDLEFLRIELSQLELIASEDKVDHPPKGTKDVSDALCGAVYRARRSRNVRNQVTTTDAKGTIMRRGGERLSRDTPRPK